MDKIISPSLIPFSRHSLFARAWILLCLVPGLAGAAGSVYVDQSSDFTITADQGALGLDTGDTVTWNPGQPNEVSGLILGTEAFISLQDAIDVVSEGGTIHLAAGSFREPAGAFLIGKSLSIMGAGRSRTVLPGGSDGDGVPEVGEDRVFAVSGAGSSVMISSLSIVDGQSDGDGGGIYADAATLTLRDCGFARNMASGAGGGVYATNGATVLVFDSSFLQNECSSTESLRGGGAIGIVDGVSLEVEGSSFVQNSCYYGGGAICWGVDDWDSEIATTIILRDSAFEGNEAGFFRSGTSGPGGGAVFTFGQATVDIIGCGFYRNRAVGSGGALSLFGSNGVYLLNSTLSGNVATDRGGAMSTLLTSDEVPPLLIEHCTIVENSARVVAGGVYMYPNSALVKNSILVGNTDPVSPTRNVNLAQRNIYPSFEAEGNNLVGLPDGLTVSDVVGPLSDHGGSILSRSPVAGSPALDGGSSDARSPDWLDADGDGDRVELLPIDQRGAVRVAGAGVDLGAVEVSEIAAPVLLDISSSPEEVVLTFDRDVRRGASAIGLRAVGGADFAVSEALDGEILTLRPSSPLPEGTEFAVEMPAGSIESLDGASSSVRERVFTTLSSRVYVDDERDFLVTTDGGLPGLDFGDTVTWQPGTPEAVDGLVFGRSAFSFVGPAVDQTAHEGTVHIAAGQFLEGIRVGVQIDLDRSITLQGAGADQTALFGVLGGTSTYDEPGGRGGHRILRVTGAESEVEVNDLTIRNGETEVGFKIYLGAFSPTPGSSQNGGGIEIVEAHLELNRCTLKDNAAGRHGGAVQNENGTLILQSCTVSGNLAFEDGGGISHEGNGSSRILNSTISSNVSMGGGFTYFGGGGIRADAGLVEVVHSTLVGNRADLYVDPVLGNVTAGGGKGGAIFAIGPLILTNSILAGNVAGQGGAEIGMWSGRTEPYTCEGVNFIGDRSGTPPGFREGIDLSFASTGSHLAQLLDPELGDNGGPTKTHRLVAGSLAFDAGSLANLPDGLDTDQRGFPRVAGQAVDLGATEALLDVYVDQAADFVPANPMPGDRVTWNGERGSVSGLVFGLNAFASVQDGIDGLESASSVFVAAGTYQQGSELLIDRPLSLVGDGPEKTRLSGNDLHRVVRVQSGFSSVEIASLTISDGLTTGYDDGAGLYSADCDLMLESVVVSGNHSADNGGGIYVYDGDSTFLNVSISGNTANDSGAGIYLRRDNHVWSGVMISDNESTTDSGGGLYIDRATLTLEAGTVSGNDASRYGGGIYDERGSLSLSNVTISGNTAQRDGGGIYNNEDAELELYQATITANEAGDDGGGIYNNDGGVELTHVIIAGNTADSPDYSGSLSNRGLCFIGDTTGIDGSGGFGHLTFSSTGTTLTDLLETTLSDNGGSLLTHRLVDGSPAVDAGDDNDVPAGLTTDQRGYHRFIGVSVDLGALEYRMGQQFGLDSDGDGSVEGVEIALGTDPNTPDQGHPNKSVKPEFNEAGEAVMTFGRGAEAGRDFVWIFERSTTLLDGSFEEIFRFNGLSEVATTAAGVSAQIGDSSFKVVDHAPPGSRAFYRIGIAQSE